MINLEKKKEIVGGIDDLLSTSSCVLVIEYNGVDSQTFTTFRKDAREAQIKLLIARNTLVAKAIENTKFKNLKDYLHGPNMLAFVSGESNDSIKLIKKYLDAFSVFSIKSIFYDDKVFPAADFVKIANLPSRNDAIAAFVMSLEGIASGFVHSTSAIYSNFVNSFAKLSDIVNSSN